ncbi:sensor histidine kinase [Dactylosporangium sp. AC04546]|uniref:sensor histidine kinase n=1 Tax=Dactylosporangium sp. AC04546 TaxID=2862460 RepID=UPI001EE003D0|nr:sensor histidine kinase [Dactylosporangium sp. AC04546]WVK84671.1 sensor histidine kinase [Dactylosporangium sp. AC04546]
MPPTPSTALAAIRHPRFLFSGWPWRAAAFVLSTPPLALAAAAPFGLLVLPWIFMARRAFTGAAGVLDSLLLFLLSAVLVGILGPFFAWPLATVERRRLRLVDNRPVAKERTIPRSRPRWWIPKLYRRESAWRDLIYAALMVTAVPVMYVAVIVTVMLLVVCALSPLLVDEGPISLGIATISTPRQATPFSIGGAAALLLVPHLVTALAGVHGAIGRALLHTAPDEELRAELVEVAQSRARLVDAFDAERRRIERDLHDGAQQKLIGLTLQLGMARLDLPSDSPAAGAVASAHTQAKELMAELRELIRGIRPHVLNDLGLPAALRELAGQAAVPVTVRADLPRRPPAHVESTAYFVVAEALTNIAKHSRATAATVTAEDRSGVITVEVTDNGQGGADPDQGTGLTGLADRVAAADGRMLLSSPPGGPTVVRVELPTPVSRQ